MKKSPVKKSPLGTLERFVRRVTREESGQSMTEFALTMPMIFMFAFIVMQTAIVLSIAHQASYASFAAARFERVKNADQNGTGQDVVDAILKPNTLYYRQLKPQWVPDQTGGSLQIRWDNMRTALPYSQGLAGCTSHAASDNGWHGLRENGHMNCQSFVTWQVPTHLGRNVYEDPYNFESYRRRKSRGKYRFTDNNIDDDQ